MKNIITIAILALSPLAKAQVIIGDTEGTATDKTSVLLEFSKKENKGIILPYNTTLPSNPVGGTIIYDATTAENAQVKYYNGTEWVSLTPKPEDADAATIQKWKDGNATTALQLQNGATEGTSGAKVVIGDKNTTAEGVLVLESTDKALLLPTVTSINEIVAPSPGMMVYVDDTARKKKFLAAFNGEVWALWDVTE